MEFYVINDYILEEYIQSESVKKLIKDSVGHEIGFKTKLEQVDVPTYHRIGMEAQAKMLGMKSFDVAIPVDFVRDCIKRTGQNPVGHVVMNYDNNLCGNLIGITREGKLVMAVYEHIQREEAMNYVG